MTEEHKSIIKREYSKLLTLARTNQIDPQVLSCDLAIAGNFVPAPSLAGTVNRMGSRMDRDNFLETVSDVIVYHEEAILKKMSQKAAQYKESIKKFYQEFKKMRKRFKEAKASAKAKKRKKEIDEEMGEIADFDKKVKALEGKIEETVLGKMILGYARKQGLDPKDDSELEKMKAIYAGVGNMYDTIGRKNLRNMTKFLQKMDLKEVKEKRTKTKYQKIVYRLLAAVKKGANFLLAVPPGLLIPPFIMAPVVLGGFAIAGVVTGVGFGPVLAAVVFYSVIYFAMSIAIAQDRKKSIYKKLKEKVETSSFKRSSGTGFSILVEEGYNREEARSIIETAYVYA